MIFIDTSAIVAMLTSEPDADALAAALEADRDRICAGHVILEASMSLATRLRLTPTAADEVIMRLLRELDVVVVPITEEIAHLSVGAFERYGKGRGHAARLNFGDCLSYGCAKAHSARLLYKGEDFSQTDVAFA